MIYRVGSALDIEAVLDLLTELRLNGRSGPHFHWTKELLQDEIWQYHFVLASVEDRQFVVEDRNKESSWIHSKLSLKEIKYKCTKAAAFIVFRHLGGHLIEITALATGEHFLRQSVMSKLMKYLIETEKPEEIWLEVHEKNISAIRLYERIGFHCSGSRSNYYADQSSAYNYVWKSQEPSLTTK